MYLVFVTLNVHTFNSIEGPLTSFKLSDSCRFIFNSFVLIHLHVFIAEGHFHSLLSELLAHPSVHFSNRYNGDWK